MGQKQDDTGQAQQSPSESAMADILANLEEFFTGKQSPERALAAICQISGRYKMAAIK